MPVLVPDPLSAGYYCPIDKIQLLAGAAFDKAFNQDPDALAPDPNLLASIQTMTDALVDGIAAEVGLDPDAGAPNGHYIASTNEPLFSYITIWAVRWAWSQGFLARGEDAGGNVDDDTVLGGVDTAGPGAGLEGQMTRARKEAEKRIKTALEGYYRRKIKIGSFTHKGIAVGTSAPQCGFVVNRRGFFPFCNP
jgi:hypothetical protein